MYSIEKIILAWIAVASFPGACSSRVNGRTIFDGPRNRRLGCRINSLPAGQGFSFFFTASAPCQGENRR